MLAKSRLSVLVALCLAQWHSPQQATLVSAASTTYWLGTGIGDVTGPVVETNMMGYASLSQTDTGLHMRQRSRAFIVAESANSTNRIVFINSDIGMGDVGVRIEIINRLSALYPGLYTTQNVALVGTHQHSGVAGYHNYLLPTITSLGFVQQSFDAIVNGSVKAVVDAHNSLKPGTLSIGNTTLLNTNINRSPAAYLNNPAAERALYQYDQDKDFSLLKFVDSASNTARGFLSFFAVHGTSIYENNTLVSTDNKGMAAYLYESYVNPTAMPGMNASFVAGFAQANVGDTTLGAFCESPGQPYDGQPCDFVTSTCGNKTEDCHGRGPGFTVDSYGFESSRIIGNNQFTAAKSLMEGTAGSLVGVSGQVKGLHTYVNMTNYSFKLANGTQVTTCPAAMGYSFAGGTTDGPGAFDFIQGDNSTSQNPFWQIVKGAVTPYPSDAQIACQYPKPILLNTGYAHTPYEWTPAVVDIQILQVGQLVMLIIPGELTTMAGRRLRNAVRAKLISAGILDNSAYVVVAGPSNTYSHYITTREEYATGVVFDSYPLFSKYGAIVTDVKTSTYSAGSPVFAVFQGANPRNNLRLEGTFLTVDQKVGSSWVTYRTDSHPSTTYQWLRTDTILGYSTVNITWTIESGTPAGTYRLSYYGDAKNIGGGYTIFNASSSAFTVG
ncbi:Neutral/alkaline nonlysosomal ceramidase [Clavulina sp. PMI_390]|nr:Neutral/alkaline nonlysosomal ceramidase [Clavulina sp. PMI_390]